MGLFYLTANIYCYIEMLGKTIVMVLLYYSSECGCFVCITCLCSGDFRCYFLFGCKECYIDKGAEKVQMHTPEQDGKQQIVQKKTGTASFSGYLAAQH